jgi:hypothetical protein
MPLLPIEQPEGIQFGYAGALAGVKLDATRGVYVFDVPNGSVYLTEALAGFRTLVNIYGTETTNVAPVTIQVSDGAGVAVAGVARVRVNLISASGSAVVSAVTTGTLVSDANHNGAIVDTDATGLAVVEITETGAQDVEVLTGLIGGLCPEAQGSITFAL